MAAGTLSVTNNSKAVVGVGTTFTTFKAGDFLTLVVGQVPYTVAIASVESDTALTLVLPFDGPTATDLAWDGVNRDTMSLATMGVTVQAQKALRLMIADENNWRAIFGDAEEITVTLPNGQVMQGMSWGYLSQLMKEIDPVEMRNLQQQAAASEAAALASRNEAEVFKNDANTIKTQTDQIKADTQAIKDQTGQIKDSAVVETEAIKQEAFSARDQAELARDTAGNHATDANNAKAGAETARDEARQWAQQIQPENLLRKDQNLNDLENKDLARDVLKVDRFNQSDGETFIQSPDKIKYVTIGNDVWGYWNAQSQQFIPLGVQQGGTGGTTDEEARNNLKIDRFVQTESDTRISNQSKNHTFFITDADWGYLDNSNSERVPLPIISGGTGATTAEQACLNLHALKYDYPSTTDYSIPGMPTGIGFYRNDSTPSPFPGGNGAPFSYAEIMTIAEGGGGSGNWSQIAFPTALEFVPKYRQRFASPARITNWRDFLVRDLNTTIDVNGYVKVASPIVKLKSDGSSEVNDQAQGVITERLDVGVYKISGTLGFNSDASWGGSDGGFSIPQNSNGLPLLWVDYEVDEEGDITLKTYHRTHEGVPSFASNVIEGVMDGEPIDIPSGRWIDLRVEMPATGLETATSSA